MEKKELKEIQGYFTKEELTQLTGNGSLFTKSSMIKAVAKKCNVSIEASRNMINAFIESCECALANDLDIMLKDFVKINRLLLKPRKFYNIIKGGTYESKERYSLKVKPAKKLVDIVCSKPVKKAKKTTKAK